MSTFRSSNELRVTHKEADVSDGVCHSRDDDGDDIDNDDDDDDDYHDFDFDNDNTW